jgi:multidrug efflux pump subunit AcrA (membrane-fusion protein)
MADGSIYPHRGRLSFVDRALDLTTGTLRIYVSFPNPEMVLKPGLFGRVRLVVEERPNTPAGPPKGGAKDAGGGDGPGGGGKQGVPAHRHPGGALPGLVHCHRRLEARERIIVEGLQNAIPGQKVRPTEQPPGQEQKGG